MLAHEEICLCVGGMGKVNAAHAATLLFTQFRPKLLILFGIGGAYPASGAEVGDIALAHEEIAGDEGVLTLDGFKIPSTSHPACPRGRQQLLQLLSRFGNAPEPRQKCRYPGDGQRAHPHRDLCHAFDLHRDFQPRGRTR